MAHWALCLDFNIRISATSLIRKTLEKIRVGNFQRFTELVQPEL
jgi:hypothetical protein